MTPQPLRSRNYAPAPGLAPYIARHYVFSVEAPDDFELNDHLMAETAFARFLLRGEWTSESTPGEWDRAEMAVFTGPNHRPMRVRVRGGFRVIGIAFCPAGWRALSGQSADIHANRIAPLAEIWGERAGQMLRDVAAIERDDAQGDAEVIAAVERHVTAVLDERGWIEADSAMHRFEEIARNHSTALVRDIASELGLSHRNFERRCHASFGMGPKAVLRRSRFLDMASAIRGLSRPDEAALAALRYYDQPQLIREFRHFIGMTPGQFEKTPTPLLDAGLSLRELRKIEDAALRGESRPA